MPKLLSALVELCVFRLAGGRTEYLLLRRNASERVYPGLWQFVTGSLEVGETAQAAALRELEEETSLKPRYFWVAPKVLSFYDAGNDTLNMIPFFAAEVLETDVVRISPEHSEFGWYRYPEAIAMLGLPEWKDGVRIVEEYIAYRPESASMNRLPL
jgi:8-oxo-dGTP pyrophosphatase MutT (NUDIX family)